MGLGQAPSLITFHRRLAGIRRNRPVRKQHFLKASRGAAGTQVIAAEFFKQFFLAMHDSRAAFDLRFRRETFTTLAGALEKRVRPDVGDDVA